MPNALFNRQLALYASVHRDMRNRATHFVGIPIIVFSVLLVLTLWRFPIAGRDVSASLVMAVVAVLGWLALDAGIGIALAVLGPAFVAMKGRGMSPSPPTARRFSSCTRRR